MAVAVGDAHLVGLIVNDDVFDQTAAAGKEAIHFKGLFLQQMNLVLAQANDELIQNIGNSIAFLDEFSLFFGDIVFFIKFLDFQLDIVYPLLERKNLLFQQAQLLCLAPDLCGAAFHFGLELLE